MVPQPLIQVPAQLRFKERVQQETTKLVPEVRDVQYPERMRTLGPETFEYPTTHSDLMQTLEFLMVGMKLIEFATAQYAQVKLCWAYALLKTRRT